MKDKYVEIVLTCSGQTEADKIAEELLSRHLVACIEFFPTQSKYWWRGKIAKAVEVRLLMLSLEANFDKIDQAVKKLHSYDVPVLRAIPLNQVNREARAWLKESISG